MRIVSFPRELENRTVAGVFPEESGMFKETPNSDGCSV